MSQLHEYELLLERLGDSDVPLAVLVGAPISMTYGSPAQGVPDVAGMCGQIERRYAGKRLARRIGEALGRGTWAEKYQAAFQVIQGAKGSGEVNAVIHEAVMAARLPGAPGEFDDDGEPGHWHLPRGVRALGRLAARHPERLAGPILTTNFDPLISLAIRDAGRHCSSRTIDQDGRIRGPADTGGGVEVVHLHGYWRDSLTLHLSHHLDAERPDLQESLRTLLHQKTLLVAAYSGWNDVFMKALEQALRGRSLDVDVLWTFYDDEARVKGEHGEFLRRFASDPRVTCYWGVDVHRLFEDLLTSLGKGELDGEGVQPTPRGPAKVSDDAGVPTKVDVAVPQRLVLMSSNPAGTALLELDKEYRRIREALRSTPSGRDRFDLVYMPEQDGRSLARVLLEEQPAFLQFSGHGDSEGRLQFVGAGGTTQPASQESLTTVFRLAGDSLRCVVLNACYADEQARLIGQYVEYVVGVSGQIPDAVAIAFSEEFYRNLAYEKSIPDAYELALASLDLGGINTEQAPRLYLRGDPWGQDNEEQGVVVAPAPPSVQLGSRQKTLSELFAGDQRLQAEMGRGLGPVAGDALVAKIHGSESIESMTHRYMLGMQHVLKTTRSKTQARALKAEYERVVVSRARELSHAVEKEDGVLLLNLSKTAFAEVLEAASLKRGRVTYWPVTNVDAPGPRDKDQKGPEPWPRHAVDLSNKGEKGMGVDEAVLSMATQLAEQESFRDRAMGIGESTPISPYSDWSTEEIVTKLENQLRKLSQPGLGEQVSDFFGIVHGADQPQMRAFATLLKSKVRNLRLIYTCKPAHEVNESFFCETLFDFYKAYETIDPDPPHERHD